MGKCVFVCLLVLGPCDVGLLCCRDPAVHPLDLAAHPLDPADRLLDLAAYEQDAVVGVFRAVL